MRRDITHLRIVDHLADKHAAAFVKADGDGITHQGFIGHQFQFESFLHLPGAHGIFGFHRRITWQFLRGVHQHTIIGWAIGCRIGCLRFDAVSGENRHGDA